MAAPITPTVGRMLHYYPGGRKQVLAGDQPMAATIAYVQDDQRRVNIGYLEHGGTHWNAADVLLVQPGDALPDERFCCWMEYQKAQARKIQAEEEAQKHNEALATVRPAG